MQEFGLKEGKIKYIKATPEDTERIYKLVQNTIKTVYPKYYPKEVVDFFCEHHNKEKILRDIDLDVVGVLVDDGVMVGTGCYQDNHITRVYVLPEFQGRGYGSYIMQQLEDRIAETYDTVLLDASLPASHLYEKRGYQTIRHDRWNAENDVVLVYEIMEKQLYKNNSATFYDEKTDRLHHKGMQEIKTQRLLLRRCAMSDAESMYKNYATDERVTRFLNWEPYKSVEEVKKFLSEVITSYNNPATYHWAIDYESEMIGSISVYALNETDCNCEVGYCIGYDYWNKGLMTEAMSAVIDFLFKEVNMHRILAKHDVDNPASGKVMQKCRMKYEGTFRKYYLHEDGTYSDSSLYSVLKEEWVK